MSTEKNITVEIKALNTAPFISAMAAFRVQAERIRASRTARIVCWIILAALVLTLEWVIAARVEQKKAIERYDAWQTRFVDDYLTQQEAARVGIPPDPKEELRKQEASALAKIMSGLKRYGYSANDYRTLAQIIVCRTVNPGYADTIMEVIQQPGQWPGYSENNEVIQKNYTLALQILSELDAQEFPPISSDFVYLSFDRDGITARDTYEITSRTHFWRYGE